MEEVYSPVLQFDSHNSDAMIGLADAQLAWGKALAAQGQVVEAQSHWQQSVSTYRALLTSLGVTQGQLGGEDLTYFQFAHLRPSLPTDCSSLWPCWQDGLIRGPK